MAITSWPRLSSLELPSGRRRQRHRRVDPDQREVGIGIVADDARGQAAAVDRGDVDARGAAAPRGCW